MNITRVIKIIASSIIGALFIVSAITKLFPIQLFEAALVEAHFSNWTLAPYFARIIISFEFLLGALLIGNLYFSKRVLKLSIVTLIIFSVHLCVVMASEGNTGNCMCFGNVFVVSPLASLIKNIILIGFLVLLHIYHDGISTPNSYKILLFLSVFSIIIPLTQPFHKKLHTIDSEVVGKRLDLQSVSDTVQYTNLAHGKHIIAFMSFTCSHCKIAAFKLHVMKKKNPNLPLFIFFYGKESEISDFQFETKIYNIPFTLLSQFDFIYRSGLKLPAIYYVDNDTIVRKVNYLTLHQDEVETWLQE